MKSIRIQLDDVHFTNKFKTKDLVVRTDINENEELAKFWMENGVMNIEVGDNYKAMYYKNKVK